MSVNCWSKSVHSRKEYLKLKYGFDVDDQAEREYESCVKWWRFWGRLRGSKKGFMGQMARQMARQGSYDTVSYMQNFDEGLARAEPEYFTRSFSALFADPRRVSCSRVLMNGGE